ncbi:MAG: butyrate kinase [Clostridiales Family XIII bacterium]|jgi:butyrate kinase|nr:butyrate kinase [Clostridiales Family XIII bacterium]
MNYSIFTLSPGSTSTKFAVFRDGEALLKRNVTHDPEKLKAFAKVNDQLPYRLEAIEAALGEAGLSLDDMDAFSAYSGGLASTEGGIFPVNDRVLEDAASGRLFEHPAILGSQIVAAFGAKTGKPAYLVNPPDSDEFEDIARISGLKGVYRESHVHVLNQKETAMRAASELGKGYEDINLVVCHVGGGLSISAHRKGKMIDGNDVLNGDGPFAPNRSGSVPLLPVVKRCFSGEYTQDEIRNSISKTGGLLGLLGTDDAREILRRIEDGDPWAKLVYDAFAYTLAKHIGSYACAMKGDVDGIVLTGGVSNDKYFVAQVKPYVSWIAPVIVYGGDFEMEALASGTLRALTGAEKTKEYTGVPVWDGFEFEY